MTSLQLKRGKDNKERRGKERKDGVCYGIGKKGLFYKTQKNEDLGMLSVFELRIKNGKSSLVGECASMIILVMEHESLSISAVKLGRT